MFYDDGYELDENGRLLECPVCRNEEFGKNAGYCRICGNGLYNLCYNVEHKNPGNARFCEICGSRTYFLNEKLLKPWDEFDDE